MSNCRINEANNRANKILKESAGSDYLSKVLNQIYSMPEYRKLEESNSANEIVKNRVGSDYLSKVLDQIYSMPEYRKLEESNSANEIVKNRVGSDYLSKVLEQIYSMPEFRIFEDNNRATEIVKKSAAAIQHIKPATFQQSFDSPEKINPNANTSLNNTPDDLDEQIHQPSIARTQLINILDAVKTDLLAFLDALDKPADVQLLYPIFFLIVSLILYLKSTPEALMKQENTEN